MEMHVISTTGEFLNGMNIESNFVNIEWDFVFRSYKFLL